MLAESITGADRRTADAGELLVMSDGIDTHCHLAQPTYGGVVCADDFESST